jgi:hypothetical protein
MSFCDKYQRIKLLAWDVINTFPKSSNGQPFLKLKNGKKLFFNIFIKKYGLDNRKIKYSDQDVARRIRLVEFFDYFVKDFGFKEKKLNKSGNMIYIIESNFYRMIVVKVGRKKREKLELLSFYNHL